MTPTIPLHPSVVHLPLGGALITATIAMICFFLIQRAWLSPRSWILIVALQALTFSGGLAAFKSGENEEKRVEKAVPHNVLHEHEERAEAFLWSSGASLALGAVAIVVPGASIAAGARAVAAVSSLVAAGLGVRTGQLGGEMVYKHGVSRAYSDPASLPEVAPAQHEHDGQH